MPASPTDFSLLCEQFSQSWLALDLHQSHDFSYIYYSSIRFQYVYKHECDLENGHTQVNIIPLPCGTIIAGTMNGTSPKLALKSAISSLAALSPLG